MVESTLNLFVLREDFRCLEFAEIVEQARDSFSLDSDACILHIYNKFFTSFIQFARDGNLSSVCKSEGIGGQMYNYLLKSSHVGDERVW